MHATIDAIENVLEGIQVAKQELLQIDPATDAIRRDLDVAYRKLGEAAEALVKMLASRE